MKRFFFPMFWIFAVFLVNVVALFLGMYQQFPWLDIPMHFLGGYTVAILGLAIFAWLSERLTLRTTAHKQSKIAKFVLEGLVVIGFTMIISVAWEIWEFLMDQFATAFVERFGATQPGIADTMHDFFNDGVGAVTAWLIWRKRS
jgi:hypothetical protein